MSKPSEFEHEEKIYEVHVANQNNTYTVRIFLDGKPVNGYSYSVDLITQISFQHKYGVNSVDDLIEDAISDVKKGNWEKYVAAVKKYGEKSSNVT
jgi:hypothetical protein